MSPTVPRIRLVSAPMVAMNTHFCHIRAMISSLMLASNPAPESWSSTACSRGVRAPSCVPIVRLAPGLSWTTSPSSLTCVAITTTPPSTACSPNRLLSTARCAIPFRNGTTVVHGPTAGAKSAMACSSAVALTDSSTMSAGSVSSPAMTSLGRTTCLASASAPGPTIRSPRSRSCSARCGRTRNATSRPSCASRAPK
jgi:hypothetical protein